MSINIVGMKKLFVKMYLANRITKLFGSSQLGELWFISDLLPYHVVIKAAIFITKEKINYFQSNYLTCHNNIKKLTRNN
ncbi:hypothetical protein BpHYR1_042663 [Brachionus plicatilis]|uniref:Uncharacterized protein n=1 Tax=Brachionus plicatilis TaxID=10195 RepID=A0A3M7PD75_BRAPC|nr:hypothetical protein BpHYR1_042663 [Brachionus plicatilis]